MNCSVPALTMDEKLGNVPTKLPPEATRIGGGLSGMKKCMAGAVLVLLALAVPGADCAAAESAAVTTFSCRNLASGTNWQMKIDVAKGLVDSSPARINAATVTWHDPDGGNYTLDRRSGALTAVFPSSTGGYFLHHHCAPVGRHAP